jgi:hypothetical protein
MRTRSVFRVLCQDVVRIRRRTCHIKSPSTISTAISNPRYKTRAKWKFAPLINTSASETLTVNTIITTASINTVTPRAIWVKGPRDRNSLIIASADEGERSTMMVAPIRATETITAYGMPCMNGM